MKKFIINTCIFFIPLIILIVSIEIYLEKYPSSFQLKGIFFNENKDNIEVLILGSSHNQNAINPEFIPKKKVSNLAFGGQGLVLDYLLLINLINKLPKLETVILELSYHSLEHSNPPKYHRNNLYKRFYNINNFNRPSKLTDNSIFFSNPSLYLDFLNPFNVKNEINEFGSVIKYNKNTRFKNLEYNTQIIDADTNNIFITRNQKEDTTIYKKNILIFNEMMEIITSKNITPIIISPPVYKTYFENMNIEKKKRRDNFVNFLLKKYPKATFLNYENDSNFNVYDFKNEDHLNPIGAEKFTKEINKQIFN